MISNFELWLSEREKLGIGLDDLFVVKGANGEYHAANGTNFTHWAAKIGEKIGVESLYCHCLRHAFTTHLKKKGFSTDIVQKIQRWESSEMVDRYNDATNEDELEDFFSKIENK